MILRFTRALLALTAFAASASAADKEKPAKADLVKLGKAATALVEVDKFAKGSAFCIHSSGLFVTNEHVVAGEPKEIKLVLDSSLPTQRILKAKVVRVDKKLDLALLRAEEPGELTVLPLGSTADIVELADLIAFGFPFGRSLSMAKAEYPAISVNAGTISALRLKEKKLDLIQMDITLNPGNSGGAIIDDRGRVLGVVTFGIPNGARVNFAIPVGHLETLLKAPDITFKAPEITTENLRKPLEFKARAVSLLPGAAEPSLKLILRAGDGEAREFPMKKQGADWVATAPAVGQPAKKRIEIAAKFGASTISGSMEDVPFKVGGKPVKLSVVRRVVLQPKPQVILADGKMTMEGAITMLGSVELDLAGQKLKVDLAKATEITVSPEVEIVVVAATVVASVEGKEIARHEARLIVRDSSKLVPVDPTKVVITPPAIPEDRIVKLLPEVYSNVVVAGAGRYLVFHLPKLKKLAVFDVNAAKVIKYIALEDDDMCFTAGLDCVVVGYRKANKLERWSLTTFELEKSGPPPFKEEIASVIMGHGSNGPIVVNGYFLDLGNFSQLPIVDDMNHERIWGPWGGRYPSSDGTVFTSWNTKLSPDSASSFVLEGNVVRHYESGGLHHCIPGPDGKSIYTAKGVVGRNLTRAAPGDDTYGYCLPAVRGDYFLSIKSTREKDGGTMTVYLRGLKQAVAKLDKVDHGLAFDSWDREDHGAWKRVFMIPDAKVIAMLPTSNDRVVLYKFDPVEALDKSGQDYLFVTSQAPQAAKAGTKLTYPITVKAKHPKLEFKLDAGPKGMEISPTGQITWTIPEDVKPGDHEVIVTIKDGSGQEIFHTFTVRVAK